ncbi:MAG TPA: Smr/MutS family protein [Steroidobacteraceae bacterium]|nr:Smr/MutS family protein [Steroidobacteraceae bacterium]
MANEKDENDPGEDDAAAFREAMRGVRPIAPVAGARAGAARRKRPRAAEHADADAPVAFIDTAAVAERLAFRRPGVRDAEMRRLRRGSAPIEDDLDLHGLTQAQAHRLLADFLEESRDRGLRRVRIIHGKGMRSGARGAVLKAAVDEWLRRRHDVLAFTSARPRDGGGGAVYVLLRA